MGTHLLIKLIKVYKSSISKFLPQACRFSPTCSEYAVLALERYGMFKGLWLAIKRVLRCNPFFPGGYDPVP